MALTRSGDANSRSTTNPGLASTVLNEDEAEQRDTDGHVLAPEASAGNSPKRMQSLVWLLALIGLGTMTLLAILTLRLMNAEYGATTKYQNVMENEIKERSEVRKLFSAMLAAQNAQLSFLLTGKPVFAGESRAAIDKIRANWETLVILGSHGDNEVSRLQNLTHEMLARMTQSVELREQAVLSLSAAMDTVEQAKVDMDQLRTVVEEMVAVRAGTIDQQSSSVRRQTQKSQTTTYTLFVAFLTVVLAWLGFGVYFLRHRERAERRLEAAKKNAEKARVRAEKASQGKTDFLATMSHELRTPLASIIGFSELLLDNPAELDRQRYIGRIQVASSSLLTLIDDVLDFSKIEAGGLRLNPQPFSITSCIDNVVSIISAIARKKGLLIKIARHRDVPDLLFGDETRLQQILLNLLNNAMKFTKEGPVVLSVEHEGSFEDGEQIRFAVIDRGIGIPRTQQDQLFKDFSQLDQSSGREFGGTGLGLAISKRLINLMAGRIGVESDEGQGSTFWISVRLPRAAEFSAQSDETVKSARPGRILVVEDLEQNQDLIRTILTAAGHEVEIANGGSEAIAAIQAERFDLVLMDVQMPVMDGITATRKIRALNHPAKDISIIAMTANVLPQQVASYRAAGMDDHLGKPFKRGELLAKLAKWLPVSVRRADAASPTAITDQYDSMTFNELRRLMGVKWIVVGLTKLNQQLQDLRTTDPTTSDREELARKAHTLVSHAAIFGFSGLSEAASKLEQASRSSHNFRAALEVAGRAAGTTEDAILDILAQISVPEPGSSPNVGNGRRLLGPQGQARISTSSL